MSKAEYHQWLLNIKNLLQMWYTARTPDDFQCLKYETRCTSVHDWLQVMKNKKVGTIRTVGDETIKKRK